MNIIGEQSVCTAGHFIAKGLEKKQVSTDLFIASALEWFGDSDPDRGTPWEKGERLADLIKKKRTLLILDGLALQMMVR